MGFRLTPPSRPGYPPAMAPSAAEIIAGLVGIALDAAEPAAERTLVLDAVRRALGAEHGVLARVGGRWTTPVVVDECMAPGATVRIDTDALGAAFDAGAPVVLDPEATPATLALGLRPRHDVLWCLALARRAPWTAAERDTLAALAPHLTLVLEHALARAELADVPGAAGAGAARELFLATLSHELRNPLSPILMWTGTLRRLRPTDTEVQRAADAIDQAVSLARGLIEDLGDVSRLERGLLELHPEPVDLRDVVRDALARHRRKLDEAGLTTIEALPPEPVAVEGDPERLRQVVAHLLRNAVKYTPAGGEVAVSLACRGGQAELRVSDSGPGLPAVLLPQLFTPFVQGPNAHGGLGVGLAVTRGLVALHHGTVEALRQGDRGGTTIVVTLPVLARPRHTADA